MAEASSPSRLRRRTAHRLGGDLPTRAYALLHPDGVGGYALVFGGGGQLEKGREKVPSPPQFGAVAVLELLELNDQALLEGPRVRHRECRSFLLSPYVLNYRQITAGRSRKNTTAGREDHVRLIRERLDDHLSTNSLRFADQPDDRILGPSNLRTWRSRRRRLRPTSR